MNEDRDDREVAGLEDEYELLGELGRGASAIVYRARDRFLGRLVAIKVVRPHSIASGSDAIERLAREARTVAKLHHPHIVTVHAVQRLASGGLALVMQLVPGRTLKHAVEERGPFSPEEAERILREIASALAYANAQGVVHRDVKSENIFLDEETGRAMLSDFGIAYSVDQESRLTMTGAAIGTPAYMAPEQIDGAAPDARSDLYSLGLVTWEMLTGRRPWEGESLYNLILKQKTEELPPIDALRPGEVPERLQYLVERMLQKHPGARWAGAEALLDKLDRWVVPSDFAQWQASARRRREEAQRRDASATRAAAASTDAATIVFRRTGADSTVPDATSRAQVAEHALARLLPLAPEASDRDGVQTIEDRPPTWALEEAPRPPIEVPAPRRMLQVIGGMAVAVALVVGSLLRGGGDTPRAGTDGATETMSAQAAMPVDSGRVTPPAQLPAVPPIAHAAPAAAPRVIPPPVPPPPALAIVPSAVAVGRGHSCVTRNGRIVCWGANEAGQLGRGLVPAERRVPLAVGTTGTYRAVVAGVSHTCGLDARGDVWCWGGNASGQLGSSSASPSGEPVPLPDLQGVVALSAGDNHTCALTRDGAIACWGANDHGQLGSSARRGASGPAVVDGAGRYMSVAAGGRHTCALGTDGAVWCWGANADRQLGAAGGDQSAARRVPSSERFLALSAGGRHTCAISSRGEGWCWGRNDMGQLGVGHRRPVAGPTRVSGAVRFQTLALGDSHSCGRGASGEAWCWGDNRSGQLGDGSSESRDRPVRVLGGPYSALSAGFAHSCGAGMDGTVSCWGSNARWQLGDGRRNPIAIPVRIALP